ncbi:MAG: altronate dehydratase family protein [Bacteroidota bacterium]
MTETPIQAPLVLRVHPADTVAVAVHPLRAGELVRLGTEAEEAVLRQDIPAGHKIALRDYEAGDPVVKYGFPIGRVTRPIARGQWVHSHNLATALSGDADFSDVRHRPLADVLAALPDPGPEPTWEGFVRPDGRVGTRNELWVLNTVGCVNRAAERIARTIDRRFGHEGEGVIDGAHAFAHPFGCSQLGGDHARTRDLLAALTRHPNCGGAVVLGLGCENNQLAAFLDAADLDGSRRARGRLQSFVAQLVGDEIETGIEAAEKIVEVMREDRRETVGAHRLVLGVKCGGSDGFSGVTANPLLGRLADRWTAWGARVLQTEVPEMFGAEPVLLERAVSGDVFCETVNLVQRFRDYFVAHDQPVYENPSPGNKDGGLTTLEEKSLGAIQKGGRAPVAEVLDYAEAASVPASGTDSSDGFARGLGLIESPGNDGVSCTALTASGATVLLFTTGRGTPLGFPAPTVKVATNPDIAEHKPHWIDFGAGDLLTGAADMDALADRLTAYVLDVASGRRTNNETNDYREIAIWKGGVTL